MAKRLIWTAEKKELGNACIDTEVRTALVRMRGEKVVEQERIAPSAVIETKRGEKSN